jgi:hypothetical protein
VCPRERVRWVEGETKPTLPLLIHLRLSPPY